MEAAAAVLAGVGGLALGSFANVVVHRVPRRESLVTPASRCPSCERPVAPRDNVPVLSWLLLGGRCRHCRAPISWRYPAVEALTAALFVLTALRFPEAAPPGHTAWDLLAFLPFVFVLVPLAFIDFEHKILPNRIVLPAAAAEVVLVGVAAALGPGLGAWLQSLAGGAGGFLAFFVLALISPRGMGMGDVKMAGLIGIPLGYLGWERVLVGFMLAAFLGAVVGLALMAVRRAGMKSQVPFGPFLAAGALVSLLAGEPIVRAWLGGP